MLDGDHGAGCCDVANASESGAWASENAYASVIAFSMATSADRCDLDRARDQSGSGAGSPHDQRYLHEASNHIIHIDCMRLYQMNTEIATKSHL